MIKKCEYCGKTFETNNKYKKYCNRRCKENHKKSRIRKGVRRDGIEYTKVCPICGNTFTTKLINKEYCSKECKNKSFYQQHKEYCKEYYKEYYKKNKEYLKKLSRYNSRLYRLNNHDAYLKVQKKYKRKRYKTDIVYKLRRITSQNIRRCFTNRTDKTMSSLKYVNYTIPQLKQHIETLFTENMSWDNYGSVWHIDHIKPLASYNFYKQDGSIDLDIIMEANSLDNLQPMFVEDNLSKSSWYEGKLYKKGLVVSAE